ncbi:MAG: hypothetical protein HPY57_14705 [Ignavibacteria bacterium]|nr:hypothetical protein [Ignavibacteria bacterium]
MNREQYEFSDVFWSDPMWDKMNGIPKYYSINESGEIEFHYLNDRELKEFLNIKIKENPDLLRDLRYKKIIRILKNN